MKIKETLLFLALAIGAAHAADTLGPENPMQADLKKELNESIKDEDIILTVQEAKKLLEQGLEKELLRKVKVLNFDDLRNNDDLKLRIRINNKGQEL